MISRSTNIRSALRSRQRGFLLNPYRFGGGGVDPTEDPHWGNVGLLMHFDGANGGTAFTDQKGAAFSRVGNPVTSTAQAKFGTSSGYFPSGSAITTAESPGLWLATGDFTIEAWVFWPSTPTDNAPLLWKGVGPGRSTYRISAYDGKIRAFCFGSDGGVAVDITDPATITTGVWHHVAFTRTGAVFRLFVDGVQGAASVNYAGWLYEDGSRLSIGGTSGGEVPFLGFLDDLRITFGVSRYAANFTPPSAPFPNS